MARSINEAVKLVEEEKLYEPVEGLDLLRKLNYVKFDPTVELHMQLGVDPRHADQMVRGTATLPGGHRQRGQGAGLRPGREGHRGRERRSRFRRASTT